jgi:uncharacterized repeat protein (TIGR03803 family)
MGSGSRNTLNALAAVAFVFAGVQPANAQVNESVLYAFSGGSDGNDPQAGVIADETGALYGTTSSGGIFNFPACLGQCGVVFKLTPARQPPWSETTLWSFSGGNDGGSPFGGLFARNERASRKKTLYGTTSFDGPSFPTGCSGGGCGTIFKLTDSVLTTLWGFTGGSDGANPFGSLIGDKETGPLYGTTSGGGTLGNGTVFEIDTIDQTLTTIYNFKGSPDAGGPSGGPLLIDDAGALYGTSGGGKHGNGTVFKLTPPGRGQTAWTETVLWSFTGGNDGANPPAGLITDESGALYGTTSAGGACAFCGTVFKLTPPDNGESTWKLATLYSFSGGSDGLNPLSTLIADGTGALYGTTNSGGASCGAVFLGCGVVFKLTPPASGETPWTETVLWTFTGSDGAGPFAGVIADDRGALYRTTGFGGNVNNPQGPCDSFGCGVVFKLTGTGFATEDEQ